MNHPPRFHPVDHPVATGQTLVPHSGAALSPAVPRATSASTDQQLLDSWIAGLSSEHSKRNFRVTADRFVTALGCSLRQATVEDVRSAIDTITAGVAASTRRQHTMRIKSLLSYGHRLGFTVFNAGATIRPGKEARGLSKRIVPELEVADVVRNASQVRDFLIVATLYAGGLRVSELVGLNVGDLVRQSSGRMQLHVLGKGGNTPP
jgi:site-specific recombinase XerD